MHLHTEDKRKIKSNPPTTLSENTLTKTNIRVYVYMKHIEQCQTMSHANKDIVPYHRLEMGQSHLPTLIYTNYALMF